MPTVTEEAVVAWAHCAHARCPGNQQEEIKAKRVETTHSYRERGGDMPGAESSWVDLQFENEDEAPCPQCGKPRDVSGTPRKDYAALSGHDPMGLLGAPQFDAAKQHQVREELQSKGIDPDRQALEQQNAELMERLAALEAEKEK